jgi:metal-dependent hydrolase (beta-lactamase superfamily II)
MKFTLSVLMENNPYDPRFKTEHGFSLLIETPNRRFFLLRRKCSLFA